LSPASLSCHRSCQDGTSCGLWILVVWTKLLLYSTDRRDMSLSKVPRLSFQKWHLPYSTCATSSLTKLSRASLHGRQPECPLKTLRERVTTTSIWLHMCSFPVRSYIRPSMIQCAILGSLHDVDGGIYLSVPSEKFRASRRFTRETSAEMWS
jgi:hypothetical protein